jgi:hypothetical protein
MTEDAGVKPDGDWIALTGEQAEAHPLYGVEGWLRAVWAWLALQIILDFFRAGAFLLFARETAVLGVSISTVSATIAAVALYQLFYLRPAFPIWIAANTVFSMSLLAYASIASAGIFVINVAVLGYALLSRRVNISYRRRAKPEWLPRVIDVPAAPAADEPREDPPTPSDQR